MLVGRPVIGGLRELHIPNAVMGVMVAQTSIFCSLFSLCRPEGAHSARCLKYHEMDRLILLEHLAPMQTEFASYRPCPIAELTREGFRQILLTGPMRRRIAHHDRWSAR